MKIISKPPKPQRSTEPSPPWRKIGIRVGTVAEHNGVLWVMESVAYADDLGKDWRRMNIPAKKKGHGRYAS